MGIIRRGKLIRVEGVQTLKASLPQQVALHFARRPTVDLAALDGMSGGVADGLEFRGQWRGGPDPLIRALASESLTSLSLTRSTLEDAFMDEYRSEPSCAEVPHVA